MHETLLIVGASVTLSLLVSALSRWTGWGARVRRAVRRAALDVTLGHPDE